ncbi:bifunctional N(6)-L-threonylcarbamoyladenine synthase/serine/threonine protein kinase [Candidatus Woesearchaeota archaeon]|nr:bifunctional N(6)-L-threonylcarbamoyladenine synthase/serine/threonine protein kinase [Candidatus Woesearchaeota archaeon]
MDKFCLGIESTAHTFGGSVVTYSGKVLSNVKSSFTTKSGGMIPHKVALHHAENCGRIVREALETAKVSIKDISLISYSASPGIGHCLRIGAMAARSLAVQNSIPLIGVNHCIAHLEIGRLLTDAKDPILLYASGANTQIIAYEGKKYRIFGETLDTGIGNFLDTLAREMGVGFPGGPIIESLASKGRKYIELPYTVKGMDVSFGGLLTNIKEKIKSGKYRNEDLAYSAQETVFAMLIEVSERALAHTGKKELLLGGGVACNKRLQEMARIMCKERGANSFVLQNQFFVDNAAMIAWLGILESTHGIRTDIKNAGIDPYLRTDDVLVAWR